MNGMVVGHVDADLAQVFAVGVEYLDVPVAVIGDVNVARVVGGNRCGPCRTARALFQARPMT